MKNFVNLRIHSSYSIKDGLLDHEKIVDIAVKNGEKAVAITDLNYMLKAVDFYEYARKKGVKPILGVDAYIERDITNPDEMSDLDTFEPTRLLLLAKNEDGYKNLNRILGRAHTENQKNEKGMEGMGFIKQSWLTKENTENIIALSGDVYSSDIIREILLEDKEKAEEKLNFYKNAFNGNFFLEIQRADHKDEYESILGLTELSLKTETPMVATHPIQFAKRSDYYYHEIKCAISAKEEIEDINRTTKFTREQYYKTPEEIHELFSDIPSAIDSANQIADMCNVKLRLNVNDLPQYPTGDKTTEQFLYDTAHEGLKVKMLKDFPDPEIRESKRAEYEARLNVELDTINGMGFPGYFLIVYDFIKWAKDNDVFVGPGRGSGAGSLVAYSLGITNLDPIPYGLYFERFLNPERVSMPDFDIDFESINRSKVIKYCAEKYNSMIGGLAVSQIATYGLLKPKAVIKAVAKTLQISYREADQISKKIPNDPKISLKDVLADSWFIEKIESSETIKKLMEICQVLENAPNSIGVHAGGVVIGKTKLSDYTPVTRADMNSPIFTQYDKDEVEKAGLVKFDFLALSNLTVLQKAINDINKREEFKNKPFDLDALPLDDKETYHNYSIGNTVAVFQFESEGMRNALKTIGADNFNDLIAIVSLFRPGPIEHIPEYAEKKKGLIPVVYPHPKMEEGLKETYGIMIYQEQVMQVSREVAGYTLGQADMLRRAMGKKKAKEMIKHREIFRKGAKETNNIEEEKADEIFDAMEKFANYGFNKSHAAAYALISYQTAYLKTHYTPEYFTAFLNVEAMNKSSKNSEKIEILLNDARENNLEILPPDINKCSAEFNHEGNQVRYGLAGIKSVKEGAINIIKEELDKNGDFNSFETYYERVGRKVGKAINENLVYAGVFDNLNPNRAQLIDSIPRFIDYGKKIKEYKERIIENKIREENNVEIIKKNEEIEILNNNIDEKNKEISKENARIKKERKRIEKDMSEIEAKDKYPELYKDLEEKIKRHTKLRVQKPLNLPDITLPTLDDNIEPWTSVNKYNKEKYVYGFYLTGHPFNHFKRELDGLKAALPIDEVSTYVSEEKNELKLVAGIVEGIEKKRTKNGDPMMLIHIGDGKAKVTMFVFSQMIDQYGDKLKVGEFIAVQAKISTTINREGKAQNRVNLDLVMSFEELKSKLIKGVNLAIKSENNIKLIDIIKKHQGNMQVTLYNPEKSGNYAVVNLDPKKFGINGTPECMKEIINTFGENNVKVKLFEKMIFANEIKFKPRF